MCRHKVCHRCFRNENASYILEYRAINIRNGFSFCFVLKWPQSFLWNEKQSIRMPTNGYFIELLNWHIKKAWHLGVFVCISNAVVLRFKTGKRQFCAHLFRHFSDDVSCALCLIHMFDVHREYANCKMLNLNQFETCIKRKTLEIVTRTNDNKKKHEPMPSFWC